MSGRSVARGYWGRPAETEETFQAYTADTGEGPFLRTGDLGFIRDGELFITGRLKDLIIIRGRNIYPQDVERCVENVVNFVRPNACAAFSIDAGGEEALAIVVEADRRMVRTVERWNKQQESFKEEGNSSLEVESLVSRMRQAVAEEFEIQLHQVAFVMPGSFPRTTSGKVQRSTCRLRMLQGTLDVVYFSNGTRKHASQSIEAISRG